MDGYQEKPSPDGVDGRPLWVCEDCGTRASGDVVISTQAALDALPFGSFVMNAHDEVYEAGEQRADGRRWLTTGDEGMYTVDLPVTLLHVGRWT